MPMFNGVSTRSEIYPFVLSKDDVAKELGPSISIKKVLTSASAILHLYNKEENKTIEILANAG